MAPIKIKHIVSFSSQDCKSVVDNLCLSGGSVRPWLCSELDRSGVLRVELQLERASVVGFIDVGNFGSAFVQVDVGRSSWPSDHPYLTLLPTATLMGPADSKLGTGRQSVRMFKKADFLPETAEQSWDRLQITCTQPFNKRSQFGLSFFRVRTTENEDENSIPGTVQQTLCSPDKTTPVMKWLSSPAIQNTFFSQTGRNTLDVQQSPGFFTRAERMVIAAQSHRRSLQNPPCSTTSTPASSRDGDSMSLPDSGGLEKLKKTKARQRLVKRSRTLSFPDKSTSTQSAKALRIEEQAGGRTHRPVDTQESATHHQQDPLETACPLCGVSFTPDFLPLHASTCMDSDPGQFSSVMERAAMDQPHSSSVFAPDSEVVMVPCPLCSIQFSLDSIQQHASTCCDTLKPKVRAEEVEKLRSPVCSNGIQHRATVTLLIGSVSGETVTAEQWREIVNKKFRFPPELLHAIRERNIHLVSSLLRTGDGIIRQLDDSEDRQWREALNLSIRLGSEDTMDLLLQGVKFDFRQIHEALLVAVDTNQPRVVKRLLDRLDQEKGNKMDVRSFSMAIFDHSIDDSQFAPGVTPLTLACQKDLYEIVSMLNQKGHEIPWPHKISCACLECKNGRQYDLLKFSLSRINTFRGIASRAYLSISSEDAMLSAFRLSRDLRRLSKKEPEFKPQYLDLEELCQEFSVELLGMCRNQSEVTTILNSCESLEEDGEDELDQQAFEEGIPNLARLRLAVNYNQKQFVAHPICQQVLSSIWCGNLSGWRGSRTAWKLLVSFGIFLTMPVLCLIYWVAPKSKPGKILKTPVIKFLLHSASYMWFLITLLGESIAMELYRDSFTTRQQNLLHNSFHMIWVVGFFWFECKEIWIEGLRSYFLDWWNCLDVMVLSMYLASFALRMVIVIKGHFLCQSPESQDECLYFTDSLRENWHKEDPQFIAEVLFAVTSMLSFTRMAYILPAHESLGTLQISIGKMIDDMMRFMFILVIIGTAFLCGINNVYVSYEISPHLGRLNETFRFLFWTMFGVADPAFVDMPEFALAELFGRILYGIYTLLIVIVLLNMLIAMITNSFQKIEDDADVEWKFARSKLYLSYFREGLTIPVPFNIIPSPKAVFYFLRSVFRICCCCFNCNSAPEYPPLSTLDELSSVENRVSYRQQVIRALVQRYIESARREFEETKRKDIGNRITELSKVIGRLHSEMEEIHTTLFDSAKVKAEPSDGSSFLGKYILGAKNNFRGFNNNQSRTSLHSHDCHSEEPEADDSGSLGEANWQGSKVRDPRPDWKLQSSEQGILSRDETSEKHVEDGDEFGLEEDDGEENTNKESRSQTVIEMESGTNNETGEVSGPSLHDTLVEEVSNMEGLSPHNGTGSADIHKSADDEFVEEPQEPGETEGNDQAEVKDEGEEYGLQDLKTDPVKGSQVSVLAKRIEEKLEFSKASQVSSPTGSDVSHDTGFGSQEFNTP